MQRFAILTFLAIGAAAWVHAQRGPLALAWQNDPSRAESAAQPELQPKSEPAVADLPASEEATALIQDARDRLYAHRSVKANLVEKVQFGDRRFTAEGRYVTGPFPTLRLEYRVTLGATEGTLLEVCDGQVLRTRKEIRNLSAAGGSQATSPQVQIARKDVRQILQAAGVQGTPPDAVLRAELGLGGVPTLLASLERTMLFDAQREEDYQGRPYVVIQGRWKDEALQKFRSQLQGRTQSLVAFIPDRIRVYFDRETLFPMRFLYLKQVSEQPRSYRPMLTLEFSDVELNQDVNPDEFSYFPPKGVDEVDETSNYLKMIEAARTSPTQPGAVDTGSPTPGRPASP